MLSTLRRTSHAPRHHRLDQAAAILMHVVMVPGWNPEGAALDLSARLGHDPLLLRLLHARVARAMLGGVTPTDRRAWATLDYALAEPGPVGPVPQLVLPRQGRAHD